MRPARFVLIALVLSLTATPLLAQPATTSTGKDSSQTAKVQGKMLDQWIKDLKDPDPGVQVTAAQTIPFFAAADARKALPALIERLTNATDTSMRVNVCLTLGDIGIDTPNLAKAIDVLGLRVTEDKQAIVRFHAAIALSRLGTDARPAIPRLVNATRDPASWEIRRAAVMGLQAAAYENGGSDMRAINACIVALTDSSAQVRVSAATALGALGRPPSPMDLPKVVQALEKALKDKDKTVVIWAYVALLALKDEISEKNLTDLAELMKPKYEVPVRTQAAQALGTMKSRAKSRVKELMAALDDKETTVVTAAAWALGNIGSGADKAVPALEELSKRKGVDEFVKTTAEEAVKKIQGKAEKPKGRQ